MPCADAACRVGISIGSPSQRRTPESAVWAPVSTLMRVDLPAPLPPRRAWTSAGRTSKSAPPRATTPPNLFQMPSADSLGTATWSFIGSGSLPSAADGVVDEVLLGHELVQDRAVGAEQARARGTGLLEVGLGHADLTRHHLDEDVDEGTRVLTRGEGHGLDDGRGRVHELLDLGARAVDREEVLRDGHVVDGLAAAGGTQRAEGTEQHLAVAGGDDVEVGTGL